MPSLPSVTKAPWLYDVEPFKIADNLYYIGNKSVSSHLFDTGNGLLILDTAYPQTLYMLIESIRKLGFNPCSVKWIVHSHCHIDHFGGTRFLVEKFGCKTYIPKIDASFLTDNTDLNYSEDMDIPYEVPYTTYFEPDVLVNDGDEFDFGNIHMKALSAAGHTPGTMAYFFTLPNGLVAAMHGGIGTNTLTSEYSKRFSLGRTWRDAFESSLKRLKGQKVDIVIGNHPKQSNTFGKLEKTNPTCNAFIDSTEWDNLLDSTLEKFKNLEKTDPIKN